MNDDKQFALPHKVGDGLTLRWATAADTEELADFNVLVHSDHPDEPEVPLRHWVRDLMNGQHPTTQAGDFTVVVDEKAGGKIVSSMNLISQTWAYEGVAFGVGRPELVGTDPAYRRLGLVRAQFDAIHARSAARGEMVQAITGIPWYYRQFGYEMTLDLGGQRHYTLKRTPENKQAADEPYRLRPAVWADLPFLQALYAAHVERDLVSRLRSEALWRYEMEGANRESPYARHFYVVETVPSAGSGQAASAGSGQAASAGSGQAASAGSGQAASASSGQAVFGEPVAYVEYQQHRQIFSVRECGVIPGHSWRAVGLFLLRTFQREAERLDATLPKPLETVFFHLGDSHPLYEALLRELSRLRSPYAWYIRIPDLPGFLRHIKPVLEKRLAGSVLAGHSGTTKLNFYTSNLTLIFEQGHLAEVGSYLPERLEQGDAVFPNLTFLQLLFGYRSFAELDYAFADCYANEETAVLLPILFPKRSSDLIPLG